MQINLNNGLSNQGRMMTGSAGLFSRSICELSLHPVKDKQSGDIKRGTHLSY